MYPQHVPLRCNRLDDCLHLKTTIDSINNITSYKVNRLAFDYYDFNRNGVIDEEDLLKMLQRGIEFAAVDQDYQKIMEYLKKFDNRVKDSPQLSPSRLVMSPGLRCSRQSRISRASRISNPTAN